RCGRAHVGRMRPTSARLHQRVWWTGYLAAHSAGEAYFPFLPEIVVQRVQSHRVRSMVRHAYQTVPYYREIMDRLRLRVEQFRSVEDLALLPILERAQLQRDPEYFLSTVPARVPHRRTRSSGSTGVPVTVFWDWASWLRMTARRERAVLTMRRLAGGRNHRATLIAVLPVAMEGISLLRDRTLIPARLRPIQQRLSAIDPPELNIELMNEFRPDVVVAFGS